MKHTESTGDRPEYALSIIIPAYNEEKTIGATLDSLAKYLKEGNYSSVEVIVAVGRGTDRTYQRAIAKKHLFDTLVVLNDISPHTKGNNVQRAMLLARGKVSVYMDADLATPLHHLEEALRLLQDYDIVNGQRSIRHIHKGHRKLISTFGNLLVQAILLPGFKDTQCGFKGFRTNIAKQLFAKQRVDSWGFDIEILALARSMGFTIAHLPVPDWQDMEGGTLNESPSKAFKAAAHTLLDLLRIRLYLLKRAY